MHKSNMEWEANGEFDGGVAGGNVNARILESYVKND